MAKNQAQGNYVGLIWEQTPEISAYFDSPDRTFQSGNLTVQVGDTVTWTNGDDMPHTVTAESGAFDSGNLNQGQTYTHTFETAGTFPYSCTYHPFMKGTVTVR